MNWQNYHLLQKVVFIVFYYICREINKIFFENIYFSANFDLKIFKKNGNLFFSDHAVFPPNPSYTTEFELFEASSSNI